MDSVRTAKILVLATLYIISSIVVLTSILTYNSGAIPFDPFVFAVGISLFVLQVTQALHLYWKQTILDEEFEVLLIVFDNPLRRAIVRSIYNSGSNWMNALTRNTGFPANRISADLAELEGAGIIVATPKRVQNSHRARMMYSISPRYRRIVRKTRSRL